MSVIRILLSVFFVSFWIPLSAQQVQAEVDRTDVLIGDHIVLTMRLFHKDAQKVRVNFNSIDTSAHFEMIDPGTAVQDEEGWIQRLVVTSFDSGRYLLPPLEVEFESKGIRTLQLTNPIPIAIGTVPPDSLGLAPIKDIMVEDRSWTDYLPYALAVLLVLIVGAVLWWWSRQKRSNDGIREIVFQEKPYERAWRELDALEQEKLWQAGRFKEYESEISTIFRRYLELQFGFPALEWTTNEIVRHLSNMKDGKLALAPVQEVLNQADLVKYAKVEPGPEAHQHQMNMVRQWISMTKDINMEEE